jgi:capsule polysaccharide export protein KpsC/LpsZ
MESEEISSRAEELLQRRVSGNEQQHDTLRAYSQTKRDPAPAEVRQRFGAGPGKKLVLVTSHVLQDAPHAYPGAHFDDYKDWLLTTCRTLLENPNVCVVVKEHPSVELFNEIGVIDRVLEELRPREIPVVRDLNTRSFLRCADVVVTCGGTVGLEFPCYGIPVVVAARPPYARFDHVVRTKDRNEYIATLQRIHTIPPLTEFQTRQARALFYVSLELLRVDKTLLGLGTQAATLGLTPDEGLMWREMLIENASGIGHGRLIEYLQKFFASGLSNFVDFDRLPPCCLGSGPR